MIDDTIREHPAGTLALICLFWILLVAFVRRFVGRLDDDVRDLKAKYRGLTDEIAEMKLSAARAEGETKLARQEALDHMKREESTVWPKFDALHSRMDSFQREDIAAHAVIGERLKGVETLVGGLQNAVALLDRLIRNGGSKHG